MGSELEVRADSLEGREGSTNTNLQIAQYGFFAPEDENVYVAAKAVTLARLETLQSQPFTELFQKESLAASGAEQVQSLPILEKTPEYTTGQFDESNATDTGNAVMALVIALICLATFFVTRAWHLYQRRKAK